MVRSKGISGTVLYLVTINENHKRKMDDYEGDRVITEQYTDILSTLMKLFR